jgi:hypothetical protein
MKGHLGIILIIAGIFFGKVAFAQTNAIFIKLDSETKNILRESTEDSWFKREAFMSALLGG